VVGLQHITITALQHILGHRTRPSQAWPEVRGCCLYLLTFAAPYLRIDNAVGNYAAGVVLCAACRGARRRLVPDPSEMLAKLLPDH
jgi:hypothetical protein